jgi:predicted nuclease with TOPRIM domain
MTLPDMHPYAGRAMTLTRAANAMTDDTEEAVMGSRLADAQDRIEELEEENRRLRKQRDHYEKALHDVRGRASKLLETTHAYGGILSLKCAAENALDRAEVDHE